jgi:signal transduction histidine kinase
MPRLGTVGRLASFHALIIASVVGIVVVQLTISFADSFRATIASDLKDSVAEFSRAASTRPASQSLLDFSHGYLAAHGASRSDQLAISLPGQDRILATPGSGSLLADTAVRRLADTPPAASVLTQVSIGGHPELVLAVPITEAGRRVGTYLAAGSLATYEAMRARVMGLAVGEGLIILLAAVVSVSVLLRRLLGSVRRLTRTAADIGLRGELGVRVEGAEGGEEVGELAATFNAMIEKIESSVALQRQMMADVSHQLRTPLTVMRGHLDLMNRGRFDETRRREIMAIVVEEIDHMKRLVERLLLLGRSLEVDFTDAWPVDLRALLLDVAAAGEMLAPRQWSVGPIPDVVVMADLDKLRGAVLNLVENAVHATDSGDTIRISAREAGTVARPTVEIAVDDSGPGIPADQRQAVLGRFARSAGNVGNGAGLGLAIVGAVARAHHGSVEIADSALGGCQVVVSIPRPHPGEPLALLAEEV